MSASIRIYVSLNGEEEVAERLRGEMSVRDYLEFVNIKENKVDVFRNGSLICGDGLDVILEEGDEIRTQTKSYDSGIAV